MTTRLCKSYKAAVPACLPYAAACATAATTATNKDSPNIIINNNNNNGKTSNANVPTANATTRSARDRSNALATADVVAASAKSWKARNVNTMHKATTRSPIINNNNNNNHGAAPYDAADPNNNNKVGIMAKSAAALGLTATATKEHWTLISLWRNKKSTERAAAASIATDEVT